jgi:hypothetical protein
MAAARGSAARAATRSRAYYTGSQSIRTDRDRYEFSPCASWAVEKFDLPADERQMFWYVSTPWAHPAAGR